MTAARRSRARVLLLAATALPLAVAAPAPAGPRAGAGGRPHGSIWAQVLHPHRGEYEALLARGRVLARDSDHRRLAEARRLLGRAIALSPRPLAAYWALSGVDRRLKNWPACARALRALYRLDPGYAPGDTKYDRNMALDYRLAGCLARTGAWEGAIHHLRRIAARGYTHDYRVYYRLGEAYMGLGRLDAAIDSFVAASRLRRSELAQVALAVAYDRDGRFAKARHALKQALIYDPVLRHLTALADRVIPSADRDYYLGLASEVAGRAAWATLYLRRYLAGAGESVWARRARIHLAEVRGRTLTAAAIRTYGSASLDRSRLVRAVRAGAGRLRRCLDGAGSLLLAVRITLLVPDHHHRAASARRRGVRVLVESATGVSDRKIETAVQCTERAASKLALPRPTGAPGTYSGVWFPLVRAR